MSDDLELAALLGEAPGETDVAFRIGALTRAGLRQRRRAARLRAARTLALFTGVGALFALAEAFGMPRADAILILVCVGVAALGFGLARLMAEGPARFMSHPFAALTARTSRH
jgi:hypothetical protein